MAETGAVRNTGAESAARSFHERGRSKVDRQERSLQRGAETARVSPAVPRRVLLRYLTTAMVTLVLVALATSFISRRLGTEEAIQDARRVTSIVASSTVEPILDDGVYDMSPESLDRLDRAVRDQILEGSLVRVKMWRPDGTIVYSDESRLIGDKFTLGADERAVFDTGEIEAELSNLNAPENRFEDSAVQLLEVYLPVETLGGKPMLFEAYFAYDGVVEAGRRVWLRFAPFTLGALVLLELVQLPLAMSLARKLQRTQRDREDLLSQAIESANDERRRIASDLHDGVVQDLAGVSYSLAASARTAGPGTPEAERSTEAATQIRDAVRSLRSLLVEIYPPNLDEEGLEAAVGDLLARVETRGIRTSLSCDAGLDRLDPEATRLLYRGAQEALRNITAHADATSVTISIEDAPDAVRLVVIDDGVGFDMDRTTAPEGHLGLRALTGLVATAGGELSVESEPGRGTYFALEVPARD